MNDKSTLMWGIGSRAGEQMRGNDRFYVRCWNKKYRSDKIGH